MSRHAHTARTWHWLLTTSRIFRRRTSKLVLLGLVDHRCHSPRSSMSGTQRTSREGFDCAHLQSAVLARLGPCRVARNTHGNSWQSAFRLNLPAPPIVIMPMPRLLLLLLLSPACFSATAGIDATPTVDSRGTPDVTSVGTLGLGYSFAGNSALNLEVEVGPSLRSRLVVGESVSYTGMGEKRGWRVGFGGRGTPITSSDIKLRAYGQYLVPFRRKTSRSRQGNSKFTLFDFRTTSVWTLAVGPEVSGFVGKEAPGVAMGLGFRLGWFWMNRDT